MVPINPDALGESIFEQTANQKPYFAPKMKIQSKDEMKPLKIPDFQFGMNTKITTRLFSYVAQMESCERLWHFMLTKATCRPA